MGSSNPTSPLSIHSYSSDDFNFYDHVGYSNLNNPYVFFNINHHPFPIPPPYHEYHPYYTQSFCFSLVPYFPRIQSFIPYQFPSVQRPLPPEDPTLYPRILKQVEYYFCEKNLEKDEFLRDKMDKYGWVDVAVIADFPRIRRMTLNMLHVLEALVGSSVVQVRGYKMRARYNWKKWINPPGFQLPPRNDRKNVPELRNQVQKISTVGNNGTSTSTSRSRITKMSDQVTSLVKRRTNDGVYHNCSNKQVLFL